MKRVLITLIFSLMSLNVIAGEAVMLKSEFNPCHSTLNEVWRPTLKCGFNSTGGLKLGKFVEFSVYDKWAKSCSTKLFFMDECWKP